MTPKDFAHARWPGDLYVVDIIQGLEEIEKHNRKELVPDAFWHIFGKGYKKSTYHDNRNKWKDEVNQAEHDRVMQAGRTKERLWSSINFQKNLASCYKAKVHQLR